MDNQELVLKCLSEVPKDLLQLQQETGLSNGDLSCALTLLELDGKARQGARHTFTKRGA